MGTGLKIFIVFIVFLILLGGTWAGLYFFYKCDNKYICKNADCDNNFTVDRCCGKDVKQNDKCDTGCKDSKNADSCKDYCTAYPDACKTAPPVPPSGGGNSPPSPPSGGGGTSPNASDDCSTVSEYGAGYKCSTVGLSCTDTKNTSAGNRIKWGCYAESRPSVGCNEGPCWDAYKPDSALVTRTIDSKNKYSKLI